MAKSGDSSGRKEGLNWPLIVGFWAVISAILLVRAVLQLDTEPLMGDADDSMRMVTATDLLRGQAWQDLVQHRDNTPYGMSLHWSRLIDAPVAALIGLATPIFGANAANAAAMIWPILLLLPLLALCVEINSRLVPEADTLTSLVLPVVTLVLLIEFLPGSVDHHNVQVLLSLVALLALLAARERWTGAVIAGLAVATSLAIGLETLLLAIVTALTFALCWLFEPRRYRTALMAFGAALGLGAAGHFLLATDPALYLAATCDILSIAFVVPIAGGGLALLLAGAFASGLQTIWQRFAVLAVLGGIAVAAFLALFPGCLRGPYGAMDPRVFTDYMKDIAEAQPIWQRVAADPITGISFTLATLIALPLTLWRAWVERGQRRIDWLVVLGFLATSVLVMVVQMRGARIAAPFAFPAAVWLITAMRRRYLAEGGKLKAAGALLGAWLVFAGTAHFGIIAAVSLATMQSVSTRVAPITVMSPRKACFLESAYANLAALPPGAVLTPLGMGSPVLQYTSHAVVSASFHRNNRGNFDVLEFLRGDEAVARRIAEERELDYVVLCPGEKAYEGTIGPTADTTWSWLTKVSAPGDRLHVFRIAL